MVRITLGHDRRFVSHQLLDLVKVNPDLDKAGSEGVAQVMKPGLR